RRQNGVAELVHNTVMRSELTELLARISDVERLMTRVVYNTANARELRTLAATIELLPRIKSLLQESKSAMLQGVLADLDSLQDVQKLIDESIVDDPPFSIREGNLIRPGYHHEVDELHAIMDDGAGIVAQIEEREKEKTGIPKLKVGYNRVFGYYIEITNAYKEQAPEDYIRKQTLTNCERYITQELKELEAKILGAKERVIALEGELFQNVRTLVGKEIERIRRTSAALARLDVLCSLASVALQQGYVCPEIAKDGIIHIVQGRHPVVEVVLGGAPFTPNDTYLDQEENRLAIITGPNMAGKSTYMRQIALITLMAQIGSFVPAESAKVSIVDSIFTRVGASDDLTLGQSTFMVEMNEVASILRSATKDSLIILDEIGRGTSTFDGMSIARSVLEYVAQKKTLGAKTLFATHYHELTALEGVIDGVKNYSIAVKKRGDDITFLRRIVRGGADESYGIEVAKLAGVPNPVVKRAKDILSDLESENPKIEMNRGAAQAGEAEPESEQIGFGSNMYAALIEDLQNMDVNTLTPIEAMQKLYELKKQTEQV
ncbi:MAG: DNA mismatch repair protein MutS, partial [Clostridiales bacterium]|nr:DNA mismatch repair protein MutS [Clostridiales bacterium]